MGKELNNVIGNRGEGIIELRLTDYKAFNGPLFLPAFLGEKWPTIDFYVELEKVPGSRPYFFVQAKSTTSKLSSDGIRVSMKKQDITKLLKVPGPTYILAVHEPSTRVFVRSVHDGTPVKAIGPIPLQHELTDANLQALHDEVRKFWINKGSKPTSSVFA